MADNVTSLAAASRKLTAKQEAFAREIAKGATNSEAYRLAYNAEGMKPESIHSEASRVANVPAVSSRIRELIGEVHDQMIRDGVAIRRHVLTNLLRESTDMKHGNASSRIRALELLGKSDVVGLFNEPKEAKERSTDPAKLEAELKEKLRSWFKA